MYTKNINVAEALRLLNRVVARFGADHSPKANSSTTPGCVYAYMVEGVLTPVCIVGQVVADLGFLGVLLRQDPTTIDYSTEPSQEGTCAVSQPIWENLQHVGINVDEDAQNFFRNAQHAQDGGVPWGQAVQYATDVYIAQQTDRAYAALGISKSAGFINYDDYMPKPTEAPEDN